MMNIVTAESKDKVLSWIISEAKYAKSQSFKRRELAAFLQLDISTLDGIFKYFERLNFIADFSLNYHIYSFTLQIEASDFISRGGFVGQEFLLLQNLDKLLLEVDHLKPELFTKAQTITTIVANISQAITMFLPYKSFDNT